MRLCGSKHTVPPPRSTLSARGQRGSAHALRLRPRVAVVVCCVLHTRRGGGASGGLLLLMSAAHRHAGRRLHPNGIVLKLAAIASHLDVLQNGAVECPASRTHLPTACRRASHETRGLVTPGVRAGAAVPMGSSLLLRL